jgi:hypothetical protein
MGRIKLVPVEAGYYAGRRPYERPAWFVYLGERLEISALVWERFEEDQDGIRTRRFGVTVSGGREFTLRLSDDNTFIELEDIV